MKIALVGSPNVGKSVIFGCLTGRYVTVSNYPGTTVEVARGHAKIGGMDCEIIDTPGLYSVFPVTDEEKVTLNIIKDEMPDVVVHVIDAKNLERMLPLTFQLMETGLPLIVVLNMFDEALELEITVDTALLSSKLGLPVVATVAVEKRGIGQLVAEIGKKRQRGREAERQRKERASVGFTPREREGYGGKRRVLEPVVPPINKRWNVPQFSDLIMRQWYKKSNDITTRVVKKNEVMRGLSRLDKFVISPMTGLPLLAAVLYFGLYKFVGGFGAGTVVDFLEGIFEGHINPWFSDLIKAYIPWPVVQELFSGEYGIVTLGIRYAVAIILPIVGLFFLVFALIEDSGYLPRLAFLLDRAFKKIGLSGRAIIPMVLGLGCDTMATMVTRTLPTKRERFIATLLLALCIPCSAQIGVILGLLSATPYVLVAWFVIMITIFTLVGMGLGKMTPGLKPSFIIEIPPMRFPQWKNVLTKTYARMEWYFKEIVPLFVAASVIIWLLQVTGAFDHVTNAMVVPLDMMGLPASSAKAFIFGFFRRDYGAAGLYDLHKAGAFTNNQLLVAVVVLTLFLPCITQFLITIKERGWKIGVGISLFVLFFAFGTGVVLNWILKRII